MIYGTNSLKAFDTSFVVPSSQNFSSFVGRERETLVFAALTLTSRDLFLYYTF